MRPSTEPYASYAYGRAVDDRYGEDQEELHREKYLKHNVKKTGKCYSTYDSRRALAAAGAL